MTPLEPRTSSRLRRAALAERRQLEQKRARIEIRREKLAEDLRLLDLQLLALDERLQMLGHLAGPADEPAVTERPEPQPPAAESDNGRQVLRGTAIRETAARVLAEHPEGRGPLHYRRWFELLRDAGYTVAGKDPLAVFLTQISRSPVVTRSTEAGIYSLDPQAPARLRRQLTSLQGQLGKVTSATADEPADLARVRAERERLHNEIKKVDRALDEALHVLATAGKPVTAAQR